MQGCDVWLNNPRKPLEASGTSGMKAAINGVPHFSIGDGWWAEGFNGSERLADRRRRAGDESGASTPRTRTRCTGCSKKRSCRRSTIATADRCRTAGSQVVKEAIRTVAPRFSARRMVKEYVERMYAAGRAAGSVR